MKKYIAEMELSHFREFENPVPKYNIQLGTRMCGFDSLPRVRNKELKNVLRAFQAQIEKH